MDDGRRSLVHHHLILIPQAALDEVKQRAVMPDGTETEDNTFNNVRGSTCSWCITRLLPVCSPGFGLIQQFAGDPDQHAVGKGRLEARFGELVEHLGDGKAVILPEVIQQAQGMVLVERTQENRDSGEGSHLHSTSKTNMLGLGFFCPTLSTWLLQPVPLSAHKHTT